MILELLTPLAISAEPMKIDIPQLQYDHQTQLTKTVFIKASGEKVAYGLDRTFNGTRTYDGGGRPFDNDMD
jgi:hypothetical protein